MGGNVLTVSPGMIVFGAIVFAAVLAGGLWAVRFQNRQLPKGWDRTGWEPQRDRLGWLATKFTWLSGGRG